MKLSLKAASFTGLRFSVVFLLVFAMTAVMQPAHAQNRVSDIKIVGTERIEPATVLSYLDLRQGDVADQAALDRGLKSLFSTGLFADVQLSETSGVITVQIIENPIINIIEFEGNDKLKDEDLLAEIQLRSRQVFTRTKVQSDVSRLYEIYHRNGRFSVQIEPKVIKLDQNRVNLVFEVTEGPVTEISAIRFVGNKRFDDDALRGEIISAESRWYQFMSSNDRYDEDRLAYDQELLRQFYLRNGYADFRVVSAVAELSKDKESFFITITLEEGERYKIGDVALSSQLRNFDANSLKDQITFVKGDWYDADAVKASVEKMTARLGDMQYAFATITPDIQRNMADRSVNISYVVNETPRVFVERIDIDGNVRTMDKVIRREMDLVEGDAFNRTKLADSEKQIRNLGFFENVEVKTVPGSAPDKSVIDVAVVEQSTGELSVGAGFSTADGPLADFRIREKNLLGKGQDLTLAATIAGERTEFDVGFTEPYFMDRDISAGVDAFHITRNQQDESSFDQRRTGGGLRLGYPLSENWRQSWRYRAEQNEITNVESDASRYVRDQEGERFTSAISQRLSYQDLDSALFPTEGVDSWLDVEYAGVGGDAKFVSGKLGTAYYYPVAENWVLNVLGEVGAIEGLFDESVQINERYFLGGNNLRGFKRAGVGPRDLLTEDSLGGNRFYRGSVELTFPLGFDEEMGIAGHAFSDFGSLWGIDETSSPSLVDETSIRAAAGLGVSWRSPFGPVRVDLASPYAKEEYDEKEAFRFSFGTRF